MEEIEIKRGIRGKGKVQNCLNLNHIYQYYNKDIERGSKYKVNKKLFRDICKEYNSLLMALIIKEGYFFKVPYRIGTIRIKKRKTVMDPAKLKPDFGLYNKSNGKYKNKHLNEHSGGYYVRFYWSKVNSIIINKTAYSFIPTRDNKRFLVKTVKEGGVSQVNKYFD